MCVHRLSIVASTWTTHDRKCGGGGQIRGEASKKNALQICPGAEATMVMLQVDAGREGVYETHVLINFCGIFFRACLKFTATKHKKG